MDGFLSKVLFCQCLLQNVLIALINENNKNVTFIVHLHSKSPQIMGQCEISSISGSIKYLLILRKNIISKSWES